jgi:capsular polysaccharide transport system permease protein
MRSILSTFLLGLMAWGILSMLVAGVREHQD